jgi:hypothetical protein
VYRTVPEWRTASATILLVQGGAKVGTLHIAIPAATHFKILNDCCCLFYITGTLFASHRQLELQCKQINIENTVGFIKTKLWNVFHYLKGHGHEKSVSNKHMGG